MLNHDDKPGTGTGAQFRSALLYVAWEALRCVSDTVTRRTNDWIMNVGEAQRDKRNTAHVDRYFDLHTRVEFWKCQRCLAEHKIEVPGELNRWWVPRAKREDAQAYGAVAWAFIARHADCRVNEVSEMPA